eukprot:scaffold53711_cov35-Phaeocystis_antarctica.AAC.1
MAAVEALTAARAVSSAANDVLGLGRGAHLERPEALEVLVARARALDARLRGLDRVEGDEDVAAAVVQCCSDLLGDLVGLVQPVLGDGDVRRGLLAPLLGVGVGLGQVPLDLPVVQCTYSVLHAAYMQRACNRLAARGAVARGEDELAVVEDHSAVDHVAPLAEERREYLALARVLGHAAHLGTWDRRLGACGCRLGTWGCRLGGRGCAGR